tara:strand:+ start:3919 stop:4116 length:198 start_codon:yes stop_codon:yes gene_type:complete
MLKDQDIPSQGCHPGLDPGSRNTVDEKKYWAEFFWTPHQMRGDEGKGVLKSMGFLDTESGRKKDA